jgi:hypothetical protein
MKKPVTIAVATALGRPVAPVPVLSDPIAIQNFVEEDCGADAWTIERGRLVALRDNGDGSQKIIKTYEVDEYGTA